MSELPTGWTTAALGDVLQSATPGFAYGGHEEDGTFQFRMNNVERNGSLNLDKKRRVPRNAHKKFDGYLLRPDDVLFNATNSPGLIGKTLLVPTFQEPAVYSNHFLRLRPDEQVLDSSFLAKWLQWQFSRGLFEGMTRQWVNQASIKREHLLSVNFPLPPLDEQRRIATILDRAQELQRATASGIQQLDQLESATFNRIFGSPSTWNGTWEMGAVGDMAESVQYGTSAKAGNVGEYKILRMGNVTMQGRLDLADLKYIDLAENEREKYTTRRGDLLFNRTNSLDQVGKTGLVDTDEPLAIAGYLVRLRLTGEHSPEFVSAYINGPYGQRLRRGMAKLAVNQANINATMLKNFPIVIPPWNKQEEFRKTVSFIHNQREAWAEASEQHAALSRSLQSRAFRGEL